MKNVTMLTFIICISYICWKYKNTLNCIPQLYLKSTFHAYPWKILPKFPWNQRRDRTNISMEKKQKHPPCRKYLRSPEEFSFIHLTSADPLSSNHTADINKISSLSPSSSDSNKEIKKVVYTPIYTRAGKPPLPLPCIYYTVRALRPNKAKKGRKAAWKLISFTRKRNDSYL